MKISLHLRSAVIYCLMVPSAILSNVNALFLGPFLTRKLRFQVVLGSFGRIIVEATRILCGVRYQVLGCHNLPKDSKGYVVMANHQSTWEALFLQLIFSPNTVILKRELAFVPFLGWALVLMNPIFINRSDRKEAMQQVLTKGIARLQQGENILIFPEGTRVAPHKIVPYSKGGAVLACHAGVDIIPVAHNAGYCWPHNHWLKYPGLVTVSIGPIISTQNRPHTEVLAEVEQWIRSECRKIGPSR